MNIWNYQPIGPEGKDAHSIVPKSENRLKKGGAKNLPVMTSGRDGGLKILELLKVDSSWGPPEGGFARVPGPVARVWDSKTIRHL